MQGAASNICHICYIYDFKLYLWPNHSQANYVLVCKIQHKMTTLQEIGRELARLRKERGLTQTQLATMAGLGQSTLARFETGGVAEFGTRKLLRLLELIGHELKIAPVGERPTLDTVLAERRKEAQP
jgi:predicted XRE-type DNA-binding protein